MRGSPNAARGSIPAILRDVSRRRPAALTDSVDHSPNLWRVRLRSAHLLGAVLLGQWHEETRIFRWRWLAQAAARMHKFRVARGVLRDADIEPYCPGRNLVSLDAHRGRQAR